MTRIEKRIERATGEVRLYERTGRYGTVPDTGFIQLSTMRQITGVSDSTIRRWLRSGKLPAQVKLSERVTAWRVEAIRQWLEEQGKDAA